jgi:multidrug efflux pump subunit AcrA (membrane-fusion protein)
LPEGIARRLQPGDHTGISSIASGQRTRGVIRELGLPRAGRLAPLVVALVDAGDWQPGTSVHVMLDYAEDPALTVPVSAIVDPGTGQTRVYKVAADRVVLIPVTAGRLVGNRVEVTGELAPGDRVVVTGHQQLLDGDAVRILP